MKTQFSPLDAGFHRANTPNEVFDADVTDKPGVFLPRELDGDFNALANALADEFIEIHSLRNAIHKHHIEDWLTEKASTLTLGQTQAAQQILQDITDLEDSGYGSRSRNGLEIAPALHIFTHGRRVASRIHPDFQDRVLCAYNGPTTEGLVNQVTTMQSRLAKITSATSAKINVPLPDPLTVLPRFAFAEGTLWKHAGVSQQNAEPFWHRGRKPLPNQARLLLMANAPS